LAEVCPVDVVLMNDSSFALVSDRLCAVVKG